MRLAPGQEKLRRRLIGVVFLLVFALLVWLSVALYNKQFTPAAMVTLYTDSVGNEMHVGADVMARGVQVGEVRQISADGTGARLQLAIQPGMVPQLPANVTAEMLPTTLFELSFALRTGSRGALIALALAYIVIVITGRGAPRLIVPHQHPEDWKTVSSVLKQAVNAPNDLLARGIVFSAKGNVGAKLCLEVDEKLE